MMLRQRMALLAVIAGTLGWVALSVPSAQAQDKPPEAPAAAPAAPATPAISAAAAPATAPTDPAAAPAAPPPQQPDSTATGANAGTGVDLTWPAPAKSDPKTSLTTGEPGIDSKGEKTIAADSELVKNIAHNKISINIVWTLVTGFLVMFMQAGFALVETGLCRAKNAAHTMAMNFMIYGLGMLGFWICGFAFMFGNYANGPVNIGWQPPLGQGLMLLNQGWSLHIGDKVYGIIGLKGFFLSPSVFDSAIFTLFLFEMVFMDTTATIPTGTMAERWNFKNFVIYGFWVGMFPYAIYGSWVWGGGWLAQSGINWGLGHGAVDFAGSGVVHMCGGMIAIAGGLVCGPRLGKYGPDGKPRPIPGHDTTIVMLGTFILAFGWFGFNPGSTLAGTDNRIAIIAVNTMLAGAAASVGTLITLYLVTGKPDPTMLCNGLLAGLVAITAPCAFVNSAGAILIGLIAGVIVVFSVFFWEGVAKIDDCVGAISVHGVCGCWGVLSVGLFANGSYGQGWGGVHKLFKDGQWQVLINDGSKAVIDKYTAMIAASGPNSGWTDVGVTGIFGSWFGSTAPAGDASQFGAQVLDAAVCAVFVLTFSWIWFKLSNLIIPIRAKKEDELAGLDIPEVGIEAYPDYALTDKSSPPVR